MRVDTVTSSDGSLLRSLRETLTGVDSALLCVAFVHERGIYLLEPQLEQLKAGGAETRLLVTTALASTTSAALALAFGLGIEIRVLNPGSGSTFHPKVYLGARGSRTFALIGSANLTGGLATNLEAGVWLRGVMGDAPIRAAWGWAEGLWKDPRGQRWDRAGVAESPEEEFDPDLYRLLRAAVSEDPQFKTLGPRPRMNSVTDLTRVEIHVETERSRARKGGAEPIPAWMFNLAWRFLKTHGEIDNKRLLGELRVHRSSAVCAILGRLPVVEVRPGLVLRWVG